MSFLSQPPFPSEPVTCSPLPQSITEGRVVTAAFTLDAHALQAPDDNLLVVTPPRRTAELTRTEDAIVVEEVRTSSNNEVVVGNSRTGATILHSSGLSSVYEVSLLVPPSVDRYRPGDSTDEVSARSVEQERNTLPAGFNLLPVSGDRLIGPELIPALAIQFLLPANHENSATTVGVAVTGIADVGFNLSQSSESSSTPFASVLVLAPGYSLFDSNISLPIGREAKVAILGNQPVLTAGRNFQSTNAHSLRISPSAANPLTPQGLGPFRSIILSFLCRSVQLIVPPLWLPFLRLHSPDWVSIVHLQE